MAWTTEDAAAHYGTFSPARLVNAAAQLNELAASDDADVVAALPAMDAELAKRGLR